MAGEYDHLLSDPAIQAAIAMQREAERLWVVDPEKHPDPQLWAAVLTVIAFAQAGGDCERVRNLSNGLRRDARRERTVLTVVGD